MRDYREITLWKDVTAEQWNDWRWQVANRITTPDVLKQVINLTAAEEEGIAECLQTLRVVPHQQTPRSAKGQRHKPLPFLVGIDD